MGIESQIQREKRTNVIAHIRQQLTDCDAALSQLLADEHDTSVAVWLHDARRLLREAKELLDKN